MPVRNKPVRSRKKPRTVARRLTFVRVLRYAAIAIGTCYLWIVVSLAVMKWIDPPFTSVQLQRRLESLARHSAYRKIYDPVPLSSISTNLQHAAVSAEDARFYQHHGFDWKEIQIAAQEDVEEGRKRGASTITQQLVKNLFLFTNRSFVRKGIEFTIVPLAEGILGKQRILELYLNVIEWGPGIYGAEAAARTWFHTSAVSLTRQQSVELAAMLPAPLHRRPGHTPQYAAKVSARMRQSGW